MNTREDIEKVINILSRAGELLSKQEAINLAIVELEQVLWRI